MGDEKRGKAFVGWMTDDGVRGHAGMCSNVGSSVFRVPVVVTPLLPDDPKPGETWWHASRGEYITIEGPPQANGRILVRAGRELWPADMGCLRRPPVLRTVTLTLTEEEARAVREIVRCRGGNFMPVVDKIVASLDADTPSPEPGR